MKIITINYFFVLFALTIGVASPVAFADQSVTIEPAAGSGITGCETTADGCYIPRVATVDVGGTVIMSNTDTAAHTFTSGNLSDGPSDKFDTGLLIAGGSFEYSPDTVGEIDYYCAVHPWMIGLIIVQEAKGSNPILEPRGEIISLSTDKTQYSTGDTIVVTGQVSSEFDKDVSITVESSNKDIISIEVAQVTSDGRFSTNVIAGGTLWENSGEYKILASFENSNKDTSFSYRAIDSTPEPVRPTPEPVTPTPTPEPVKPTLEPVRPTPEPSNNKSRVIIEPAAGSGITGCETTADGCYIPRVATVDVGGTVIMSNTDTAAHTFTAGNPSDGSRGEFDTSLLNPGGSFEYIPDTVGEIDYYCVVHPWMIGLIIVNPTEGSNPILEPRGEIISLSTDKTQYSTGDTIVVTGQVSSEFDKDVSIIVEFSNKDIISIEVAQVSSDGRFSTSVISGGTLWENSGEYKILASFENSNKDTSFSYRAIDSTPEPVRPTPEPVRPTPEPVRPTPEPVTPTPKPSNNKSRVIIEPAAGSGLTGCEDTAKGCYIPRVATVDVGGTVIMSNTDTAAHTFTSGNLSDGPSDKFDTGLLIAGGSFEYSPNREGEIDYYCQVHPWMVGLILVGENTTLSPSNSKLKEHIDLNIDIEDTVFDINTVIGMNISLSGNTQTQTVAIEVTDFQGTTVVSRSVEVESDDSIFFEFRIDENFKQGNYEVIGTTFDGKRVEKEISYFKVKSQFNSFKIETVQVTDQKGNPSELKTGEIGFIKINIESNKSITSLITINIFDAELTSVGIGSINTTLSSGNSEIILSFMIPKDIATGPANIYVNAFSDWPSEGGIALTAEASIVEEI